MKEIIEKLLNLGYPHNFQHERSDIAEYMYSISEIIREAHRYSEKKKTNADVIREMSDEAMAKFIPDWSYTNACKAGELSYIDCNNKCEKCVSEWLKQPYGGDTYV